MAFRYGAGPILDVFTGAVAGYSLRRISSAYTGSAIRVRRDLDNTEADIAFYRAGIDESALSSFVGAGSAYVRTWYDQSGSGRHISQATTTNQPLLYSSGSYLGYLNFTSNKTLAPASAFNTFGSSNEMTYIDVHKPSIDTGFCNIHTWGGSSNLSYYPGGGNIRFYTPSVGNDCFTFPVNNKWAVLIYGTIQGGVSGDGIAQYRIARSNGANGSLTGTTDGYGIYRDQWTSTTFSSIGGSLSGTSTIQRREFIIYNYIQPSFVALELNINGYYKLY